MLDTKYYSEIAIVKSKIYNIIDAPSPTQIRGNGKKGLLIVIKQEDIDIHMQTLQGLTKAIHHDLAEDVTTVILQQSPVDLSTLIATGTHKMIICIGVDPADISLHITAKKYFPYQMEKFRILISDSLSVMNADKTKKMAFWQNLQNIFLQP